MPRYAAAISEQDLVDKILKAYNDFYLADGMIDSPVTNHLEMQYGFVCLSPQLTKDLSKIQFDEENRCTGMHCFTSNTPDIMEAHTTSTGVTYYGCMAGGDWENPIYFIIYWDGKQLRGYIPTRGQCYDVKSKAAYGSGEEEEPEECEHDPVELLADIESRIEIKGGVKASPPKQSTKKVAVKKTPAPVLTPITSAMIFPINHSPPIWSQEAEDIRAGFYNFMASCGVCDPTPNHFAYSNYIINLARGCKVLADIINNPTISVTHVICALERIAYENSQGLHAIGYAMGELYGDPNSKTASPVMTERYGHILYSDYLTRNLIDNGYIPESVAREAREKFPLSR